MDDAVLCNDVTFADERHPYNVRAFVIGNEYGALCLVWAAHDQEALDVACDEGLIDGLSLDAETVKEREEKYDGEGVMRLGNASEPFDSEHAWIDEITLTPAQDRRFAEARGAAVAKLSDL
jgi:hypothetical protein